MGAATGAFNAMAAGGGVAASSVLVTNAAGTVVAVSAATATFLSMSTGTAGVVGAITGASAATVALVLGISESEAKKLKNEIRKFQRESDAHLRPGESYTFEGSLSLVRSVYVLGGNNTRAQRDCWTAL